MKMDLSILRRRCLLALICLLGFLTPAFGEAFPPAPATGDIAFAVDTYSLRGEDGIAYEEIAIKISASQLQFERVGDVYVATYSPRLQLFDADGKEVRKVEGVRRFTLPNKAATRDKDRYIDDVARFQVPPGRYQARLEVSSQPKKKRGLAEFGFVVPEVENGRLAVSDLFFFRDEDPLELGDDPERFRKYGHFLIPQPERSFRPGDPVRFYVQLFGIGQRRHRVTFRVKDQFGHSVFSDVRDFGRYRASAHFIEGIPTRNLPAGVYGLEVDVSAGEETIRSGRQFTLTGIAPTASKAFSDSRDHLLKLIRDVSPEAAERFSALSGDSQALFAHGFWLQHDAMLARTYVGLVTGWGRHEVRMPLLNALKHERTMMKRVDKTFGERLGSPDTLSITAARKRLDLVLDDDTQDPYALTADALLALEAGLLAEGEIFAKKALERAPDLADAHNAIGLSQIGRSNWKEAQSRFAKASDADPGWHTPRLNSDLALFISGKGDDTEELRHIRRAATQDLSHPDVYYIGARLLERYKRLEESADAYVRQIAVNPLHARARFDLGRVRFKQGKIEEAMRIWRELMEALPAFRSICVYPLLDAYLASGETGKAQALIAEELRTLTPEARARVEDISLAAGPDETAEYNSLPEEDRPQFVRAFWQRLDPTPATPGNERLVEHHRRVICAMQNFSTDGKTWDRRGDVYIRYGEPRHISKRSDIRFETDREVVRVKDRLQTSLTPEAKEEILARAGRYRTSVRDIVISGNNAARVEGGDFESIDYEMNPNRSFFVSTEDQGPEYVRGTEDLTQRGKTREHLIRGIPLFPVDGSTPWEYWIYPDVAGGIEVVFTSPIKEQAFEFPDVTMGRKISEFNQLLWNDRRPDVVFARAKNVQPSLYETPGASLDLYHHSADYQGREGRSRLEVYFGVPLQEMTDSHVFERGIALFDSSWTPVYRKLEPMTFSAGDTEVEAGTLAIDEVALQVPPGKYYLGVQVNHPATNRRNGQTLEIVVEDYAKDGLRVSDIELAGSVVTDSTATQKGGLRVVSMPSRTYKVGQSVLIYYEVYGLARDAFGQTLHRVDYRIAPLQGKLTAVRVLRALGRFLGIEEKSIVTISYERTGTEPDEHNYLEIDPGESKEGLYELTVTVTDLTTEQVAEKSATFLIGK